MKTTITRALGALLLGAAASTCGLYDIEPDEPCRQAGYSIASRTFACTGDGSLANGRYERFSSDFRCTAGNINADSFRCAEAIGALTCDQAAQNGDDLHRWATASPRCGAILQAGATPNPLAAAGLDGLASDERCWGMVRLVALARASCAAGPAARFEETLSSTLASLDALYTCREPDLNNLAPGQPRDAAALLTSCLASIDKNAPKSALALCEGPDDAWYRSALSGCQFTFLQPR